MKKLSLLLISTYNVGLGVWKKQGLYDREIGYYKKLSKFFPQIGILTYDKINEKPSGENYFYYFNKFKLPSLFYSICCVFLYFKSIKKYDIIKTNQFSGSWTALLIKFLFRKKIFILRGGHAWIYESSNKLIQYLSDIVIGISLNFADLIFFASIEDKNAYLEKFGKKNESKMKILPNSIDVNLFSTKIKEERNTIKIIMIGRLVQMKNFQNVLNAVSMLDNSIKSVIKIDIIGNGEYSLELKKITEDEKIPVVFHGSLPNDQISEFLKDSDIYILPQLYGSGISKGILEAMSTGNIVIVSDIEAHRNTVSDKVDGFLCGFDKESIKSILEYVMKNFKTEEIKSIRTEAVKKIHEKFSMDKIIEKEYEYISEIYNKKINNE